MLHSSFPTYVLLLNNLYEHIKDKHSKLKKIAVWCKMLQNNILLDFLQTISACLSVYVCLTVCLYVCMCLCVFVYVCMSVCLSVCMSVYVCLSVCMYACISGVITGCKLFTIRQVMWPCRPIRSSRYIVSMTNTVCGLTSAITTGATHKWWHSVVFSLLASINVVHRH